MVAGGWEPGGGEAGDRGGEGTATRGLGRHGQYLYIIEKQHADTWGIVVYIYSISTHSIEKHTLSFRI